MKFGDKFKDLRKQARDAVAENRDKIHDAVDVVSTTVDQKTGGKHTAKIAKFGEQAGAAVDRFTETETETETESEGESKGDARAKPTPADGSSAGPPSGATEPTPSSTANSKPPSTADSAHTASAGPTPPAAGDQYGGTPPAFDE